MVQISVSESLLEFILFPGNFPKYTYTSIYEISNITIFNNIQNKNYSEGMCSVYICID